MTHEATTAEWPPNWARTLALFVGLGLIVWEAVVDGSAHLIVYGPAFALTGLPIARGIEKALDKLPWGKDTAVYGVQALQPAPTPAGTPGSVSLPPPTTPAAPPT